MWEWWWICGSLVVDLAKHCVKQKKTQQNNNNSEFSS